MTQELSLIGRAEQAIAFSETKEKLAALAKQSERIVGITNSAGREECHAARMRLKNMRIEVAKRGKDARDEATKFSKAVIGKENELIAVIEPEETRLQGLQDAWDAERERERQAKIQAERERLAAIERQRIEAERAEAERIQREKEEALAAERAKLEAERAELERQRAEQEQAAAVERARVERERAEAEAVARAERERQEAQLRKEREEHEAKLAEERRAARDAQERREAEQAAERRRLAEEREALERQQAEQRRAEEARIDAENKASAARALRERLDAIRAGATLLGAARDALLFLIQKGFADEDVALALGFAIDKETTPEAKAT